MKLLFIVAFIAATITAIAALPFEEIPPAVNNVEAFYRRKVTTTTKHKTTSTIKHKTTSTTKHKTTSTSQPQPTSSKPSGQTFAGEGTYYDPGLGACGKTNKGTELIAAINAPQYGNTPNPNNAPVCGKCALVKGPLGQVKVKIVDRCPVCKTGDLDLSPSAFNKIGKKADGRIKITWSFVAC